MGLDTSNTKSPIHISYGRCISDDKAALIPHSLVDVCNNLGIPVVYIKTDKGNSSVKDFRPLPDKTTDLCYLHPHFLKDERAQEFVGLLTELTKTELWGEIAGHLRENYPIYVEDLEAARDRFAPELLLPEEVRYLAKVIPVDSDKSEVAYLAARIKDMTKEQRDIFNAAIEADWGCNNVAALINLTENLDCFKLLPIQDEAQYGDYKLGKEWAECAAVFQRLENSEDPAERAFAILAATLEQCVDEAKYGKCKAEQESGKFTSKGVITKEHAIKKIYHGIQDIPDEYREAVPIPEVTSTAIPDLKGKSENIISEKIKLQIVDVEENIGANLFNLNEATYSAAVAGHDELVDFIHEHEQEYVDYIRQTREGYRDADVIKEFGYKNFENPEKPSVLNQIAKARKEQRTKPKGHGTPASAKKKSHETGR